MIRSHLNSGPYLIFMGAFLTLNFAFALNFWLTLSVSTFIYVICGGHKFLRIFYHTFFRDMKLAVNYVSLLSRLRLLHWRRHNVLHAYYEVLRTAAPSNRDAFLFQAQRWTYPRLEAYSNRLADLFLGGGGGGNAREEDGAGRVPRFARGQRVCLFMHNRPAYVAIWLGLAKAGLVPALINYNLRHHQLKHSIRDANAVAMIYGVELEAAVQEIAQDLLTTPTATNNAGLDDVTTPTSGTANSTPFLLLRADGGLEGAPQLFTQSQAAAHTTPPPELRNVAWLDTLLEFRHGEDDPEAPDYSRSKAPRENNNTNHHHGNSSSNDNKNTSSSSSSASSFAYGEHHAWQDARFESELIVIYTSGTTGLPKGARISHLRFFMFALGVRQFFGVGPADRLYTSIPLYHTAGGMIGAGMVLLAGCSMAIPKRFSASKFWDDVIRYDCNVVQYVGELCSYLLKQPERPQEKQHRVRLAFGNGIRRDIWQEFQTRFCVPQIGEFYGATESNSSLVNTVNKVGAVGFTSVLFPFVYPVRLIKMHPVTQEPVRDANGLCVLCGPGEPGQMIGLISSSLIRRFEGYINNPEATQRKIICNVLRHGDRAMLSGDLLEQDEFGFFYFKDRLGDTYRWKGENVSTLEVEGVVSHILHVQLCAVFGVAVPNMEGKAGMLVFSCGGDGEVGDDATAAEQDVEFLARCSRLLDKLAREQEAQLAPYSRPVFVRVKRAPHIDVTGTFKLKKTSYSEQGFDPARTHPDPVFFLDTSSQTHTYQPITQDVFARIQSGQIRL